jgi:hypothetical protein
MRKNFEKEFLTVAGTITVSGYLFVSKWEREARHAGQRSQQRLQHKHGARINIKRDWGRAEVKSSHQCTREKEEGAERSQ